MLLGDMTRRDLGDATELQALGHAVNRKSLGIAQRGLIVAFETSESDIEAGAPYRFLEVTTERE